MVLMVLILAWVHVSLCRRKLERRLFTGDLLCPDLSISQYISVYLSNQIPSVRGFASSNLGLSRRGKWSMLTSMHDLHWTPMDQLLWTFLVTVPEVATQHKWHTNTVLECLSISSSKPAQWLWASSGYCRGNTRKVHGTGQIPCSPGVFATNALESSQHELNSWDSWVKHGKTLQQMKLDLFGPAVSSAKFVWYTGIPIVFRT